MTSCGVPSSVWPSNGEPALLLTASPTSSSEQAVRDPHGWSAPQQPQVAGCSSVSLPLEPGYACTYVQSLRFDGSFRGCRGAWVRAGKILPPPSRAPLPQVGLWGLEGGVLHARMDITNVPRAAGGGAFGSPQACELVGWLKWHNARRHPDKNTSVEAEGGAKFQRISAAYQHLINPPKPKRKIIINMGGHDVCVGEVGS